MKKRIAKLVDVKSILTLVLAGVFSYLAITGRVSGTEFLTIFTLIISFYFNKQKDVKEDKEDKEDTDDGN